MSQKQLDEVIAAAREASDLDTSRLVLIIRDNLNEIETVLLKLAKEGHADAFFMTRALGTIDIHLSALARQAIHAHRIRNGVRLRLREVLRHLDVPPSA